MLYLNRLEKFVSYKNSCYTAQKVMNGISYRPIHLHMMVATTHNISYYVPTYYSSRVMCFIKYWCNAIFEMSKVSHSRKEVVKIKKKLLLPSRAPQTSSSHVELEFELEMSLKTTITLLYFLARTPGIKKINGLEKIGLLHNRL